MIVYVHVEVVFTRLLYVFSCKEKVDILSWICGSHLSSCMNSCISAYRLILIAFVAMKAYFMTAEKYNELESKLQELKTVGRRKIADKLDELRKSGDDTAFDSTYAETLAKQTQLEDEILRISQQLKGAKIIKKEKVGGKIQLGSEVIVEFKGRQDRFMIVGELEANPSKARISVSSPVGKALIGHKEGDEVVVETPTVKITYTILEVI